MIPMTVTGRRTSGAAVVSREKIFVVEDEADILEVIQYNLARDGFAVSCSRDGQDGLRRIKAESPDLVVLDLMLPGLDGLEICRRLKGDPLTRAIPVVMVTAKGEESDVVLGLGVGADDYMIKPFSPKELLARIKAVLRRGPLKTEAAETERIVRGEVIVDAARHEVLVRGKPVVFTATEFRLLRFLAAHPGRVFTRDQLIARVLGDDAVVTDRNIDVHVTAVRRKLGPERELVETVRGVGYRVRDDGE
jgi:two-component system phosphate regulon response regulator PhoB